VLIRTVVASLLEANCYLLVDGRRVIVVDPGAGVGREVREMVTAEALEPTAVLLTHGHLDHAWDAAEISDEYGIPVHIHAEDAYRLRDLVGSLGPTGEVIAELAEMPGGPAQPKRIEPFGADGPAGLPVRIMHAPGHTEGSTVYLVDGPDGVVALTGDVLFAGSIGRTDLPGGDEELMTASLACLARLDADTRVLPGHGPGTTIAAELARNPFLRTR
jgi:hydroxyacylglutathione hydrolase